MMVLKSGSIPPLLELSSLMQAPNYESFQYLAQGDSSSDVVDLDRLWPTLSVQNQYKLLARWLLLLKQEFKFPSFGACSSYLNFYKNANSKTWALIENKDSRSDAERKALRCIKALRGLHRGQLFNLSIPVLYYVDLFLNTRSALYDLSIVFGHISSNVSKDPTVAKESSQYVQLNWGDYCKDNFFISMSSVRTAGLALAAVVGLCAVWGVLLFSNTPIILQCCLVLILPLTSIVSEMYFVRQASQDVPQPIKAVGLRLALVSIVLTGIGATALWVFSAHFMMSVFYVAIIFLLAPIILSMLCYEWRLGYVQTLSAIDFGWADPQNVTQDRNALNFLTLKAAMARRSLEPAQKRLRAQTPLRPHGRDLQRAGTPPPWSKKP